MTNFSSYGFGWKNIIIILGIVFIISLLIPTGGTDLNLMEEKSKAALIKIRGQISNSEGPFFQDKVTPQKIRKLTEKAMDKSPDAIIFSINSPGGSVVASKDIKRIIEDLDVPTYCQYRDIATSGAFWLSMGCDKIVSDSLSLTAGVGATSSYLEFSGLLNKLGIEYVNLTTGKFKEIGSPFRNITESERKLVEEKLNKVKEAFLDEIAEERNLSHINLSEISQGQTLLGEEAKKMGLVDHLGGRDKVIEVIKDKTGSKEVKIEIIKEDEGMENLISKIFTSIGYGIGSSFKNGDIESIQTIKK